jgi:DNA-binding IclR family transcriptional regulator
MAVLRLLAGAEHPLGVNAIARELSLAPSSCFKILKTLLANDYVEIDGRTKGYSLGYGAIAVARRALDPSRAFATIRSRLEETAQAYSIAIGLWRMLPNSRMVLIGFAEGSNQMRIHMPVGQRLPVLVGAVGRAIAARLDLTLDELKHGFEALRWQTPLSFAEYVEQVEQAKQLGYGFDGGHFAPGVSTVAVTIVDESGAIRYGLSGIMFSGQHSAATREKIAHDLIEVAEWASVRLVSQPLR